MFCVLHPNGIFFSHWVRSVTVFLSDIRVQSEIVIGVKPYRIFIATEGKQTYAAMKTTDISEGTKEKRCHPFVGWYLCITTSNVFKTSEVFFDGRAPTLLMGLIFQVKLV